MSRSLLVPLAAALLVAACSDHDPITDVIAKCGSRYEAAWDEQARQA